MSASFLSLSLSHAPAQVIMYIQTPVSISITASVFMCRSIGGDRGSRPPPPPPQKITCYMGFHRNKYLDPLPPGRSWTPPPPLDPWKSIVFSVIKPLDPLLYIWVRILKTTMPRAISTCTSVFSFENYVIPYRCANLINTGDSTLKC